MTKQVTHKIQRYIDEVNFCFSMGADWKSKLRLAQSTLRYHYSNYSKSSSRVARALSHNYKVNVGGKTLSLQMRELSGDLFIFHEIFLNNVYTIPVEWQHDVKTIVDLGANIGLTTIYLTNLFPTAHFVCVEPNPETVSLLRHNLSFLNNNLTVIEGAISDHTGQGFLNTSCAAYNAKLDSSSGNGALVQLYTMQELMNQLDIESIDILKVDIEGAEKDLFCQNTQWLQRVKTVLIELHGGYHLNQFAADMRKNGFTVITPNSELGNNILAARNTN